MVVWKHILFGWLVLSDEQMSKRWPFPYQMTSKGSQLGGGGSHLPVGKMIHFDSFFRVSQIPSSNYYIISCNPRRRRNVKIFWKLLQEKHPHQISIGVRKTLYVRVKSSTSFGHKKEYVAEIVDDEMFQKHYQKTMCLSCFSLKNSLKKNDLNQKKTKQLKKTIT